MAKLKRTRLTMADLRSRTVALANDASANGDEFLAYLYTVALQHIEERLRELPDQDREARMSGEQEMRADPQGRTR